MQSTARNNQFLMLDFLRGQLDEVNDSLNSLLIENIKHDDKSKKELSSLPNTGVSKEFLCTITIRNVGEVKPKLIVEELSRLTSAVLSLTNTIEIMKASSVVETINE